MSNKTINNSSKQNGFTLVELLVAVAIFSLFVVMTTGSLSNIMRADRKLSVLRTTQENCRYVLESIAREARGANGELDIGGVRKTHAYKIDNASKQLTIFTTDLNLNDPLSVDAKVTRTIYSWDSTDQKITKKIDTKRVGYDDTTYTNNPAVSITDPAEMKVSSFIFATDPNLLPILKTIPPRLILSIKAVSTKGDQTAEIVIDTSVSPRNY